MGPTSENFPWRLSGHKHDYLPGTTIFREIDIDRIVRTLNLLDQGENDGKMELPLTHSKTASAAEKEIARQVVQYWTEATQGARRAHKSLAGRWASLTPDTQIDTLRGKPAVVAETLNQVALDGHDRLTAHYAEYSLAQSHLANFQEQEKIVRPPHAPRPWIVKFGLLLAAFAIELAINTASFASYEEYGIAGALMDVMAIPILNIGIAWALVHLLVRQILRPDRVWSCLGALAFYMVIAWLLGFNLAIAHLRDSLPSAMTWEAGQQALKTLRNDPLGLASVGSWLLFGAGFGAGSLGAVDGWFWNDPHPGYTRRHQAVVEAAEAFRHYRDSCVTRLRGIAEDAIQELRNAQREAETSAARRPELSDQVDHLCEDIERYREHLRDVADDLAARYRRANVRARSTPPPGYFQDRLDIELAPLNLSRLSRADHSRDSAGLLTKAMETITEAGRAAYARLPTLSEWPAER